MNIALTHTVSPEINHCELSHRERERTDVAKAVAQHSG